MELKKFFDLVNECNFNRNDLETIFSNCVKNEGLLTFDVESERNKIQECILNFPDSKKTAFALKLTTLNNISKEKIKIASKFEANDFIEKAKKFSELLIKLLPIYESAMNDEAERLAKEKSSTNTVEQGEVVRTTKSLNDLKADINRASLDIKSINDDLKQQNQNFDSKVFQVLINTVAILGIFVAIAFVGFEVTSIFSMIDIKMINSSLNTFFRSIFYFLLSSWVAYNLLLLLVYFVYKLSRPIQYANSVGANNLQNDLKNKTTDKNGFYHSIKLTPFIIMDVILFVLVIVFFFAGV